MNSRAIYLGSGRYLGAIGKSAMSSCNGGVQSPVLHTTSNSFTALQVNAEEAARLASLIPGAKPILVLDPLGWRKSPQPQEDARA